MKLDPLIRFDLVDLTLFVNVVDLRSLTAGAERTALSAAAASVRLRNLEEALEARLLERSSRGMATTPAGSVFAQYARETLASTFRTVSEIGRASRNGLHLRVAANIVAHNPWLTEALAGFLRARPDAVVTVEKGHSDEVLRRVREGALDLGIVAGDLPVEGVDHRPFRVEEMVIVTPAGHALAASGRIAFAETARCDFVTLDCASANFLFIQQQAERLRKAIRIRAEVPSFEALCEMVAAGAGVGLVPRVFAEHAAARLGLAVCALSDRWALRPTGLCVAARLEPGSGTLALRDHLLARAGLHEEFSSQPAQHL